MSDCLRCCLVASRLVNLQCQWICCRITCLLMYLVCWLWVLCRCGVQCVCCWLTTLMVSRGGLLLVLVDFTAVIAYKDACFMSFVGDLFCVLFL